MSAAAQSDAIAIIGMAGRFPKAASLEQFWKNLAEGVEAVTFFSEAEDEGSPPPGRESTYVRARAILEGADLFDADYFGVHPKEAELMDPQHRIFLECAAEALERAGYDPDRYEGSIGVFGGMGANSYFARNLLSRPDLLDLTGEFQAALANDKDYLPMRVSYKLNLRGPSLNIQTSCSTSLVAICVACQNLLHYTCDMALAGGVSIAFPQRRGYRFQEGGIFSKDGHCRAFDASASGAVSGDGAGLVVLKRLEEARVDGDEIWAVIRGFAVNNDGSNKIGYTAPGVAGQAEVIRMAQAMAEVSPESIGYIEAHGTGTPLGDPIEVAALTQAFRAGTAAKRFCALGSLKSSIGHLDAAAGVAGLIKTALALKERMIPPTLHFERPNPAIDFANSPFVVNGQLRPWERGETPRRAGVSSFGIGGTNAHVVLEEAPEPEAAGPARPAQLIPLSARTPAALNQAASNLAARLEAQPALNLADAAFTLQAGRRCWPHRRIVVASETAEAARLLRSAEPRSSRSGIAAAESPPVVFLFPGHGAQQARMGRGLYDSEPVFRAQIDAGCEILEPRLGVDLRSILFPASDESDERAAARMTETRVAQPALFLIDYSLARLWMSWGVQPEAMLGHSVGEYVAACLAGVFGFEQGLALVARRAEWVQELPRGAMLAARISEADLTSCLGPELSLAAVNSPALAVASGPVEAIADLQRTLEGRKIACRLLPSTHAFHSAMLDPMLNRFGEMVRGTKLAPPQLRYLSNVTGGWITDAEAVDPGYWVRHLRGTVRFAEGLRRLGERPERIYLEAGPGQNLGALAQQCAAGSSSPEALSSLPRSPNAEEESAHLLSSLGRLWLAGVKIDWRGFHAVERRRRIPLPAYPFERKRHWVEPGPQARPGRWSAEGTAAIPNGAKSATEAPDDGALTPREIEASRRAGPPGAKLEPPRKPWVERIIQMLAELSGRSPRDEESGRSFVEMGFDSLFLSQFAVALENRFGVRIAFRQLMTEFSTVDSLAEHLDHARNPSERGLAGPASTAKEEEAEAPQTMNPKPAERERAAPARAATSRLVPLTDAQREIWLACQVSDQASAAYHESVVIDFNGAVDRQRLEAAFQAVSDRHEALRTTFAADGQTQEIHPSFKLELPFEAFPEGRAGERSGAIEAWIAATQASEALRTFDLTAAPPIRLRFVEVAPARHLLFLTVHHLICDGHSVALLLREASAAYSADGAAAPPEARPALQLGGYVDKQVQDRTTNLSERASGKAHWLGRFSDGIPMLELPTDFRRAPIWKFEAARARRAIDSELTQRLRKRAAEENVTLFTLLLAAYAALLHRLSRQTDLVVGVPVADRALQGADRLIAHCVRLVPARIQVEGTRSFSELTQAIRADFLEGCARGEFSWTEFAPELGLIRDPRAGHALAATFNLDRVEGPFEFRGVDATVEMGTAARTHFELSFNVAERDVTLELEALYASALWRPETIDRWMGHFETLLRSIVEDSRQPVGELALLTATEERELLLEWETPIRNFPTGETLVSWFENQVEQRAEFVAVIAGEERLSYRALNGRANRLARRLRAAGVEPESLVALFVERGVDLAVGLLAILKAGGCYLPLDPAYPPERLAFMIEDGRAQTVLTQEKLRNRLPAASAEIITFESIPAPADAEQDENLGLEIRPENLAYVIYTSGSTGQPKGTLVTHDNVVRLFQSAQPWFEFDGEDVWTLFHSHAFDFSVWEFWGALLYGGALVIVPYFVTRSPKEFYELLARERVTILNQTPSAFRELAAFDATHATAGGLALRYVIFGGEALSPETLRGWFDRHGDERPQLVNMYGITETTVHVTYRPLRKSDLDGVSVIGVPLPDLRLRILDSYGGLAPRGVPGELCVGGAGVARGYLNRPEQTAAKFIADRFLAGGRLYRSGDLARFLPGHDIEYLGRLDDQVKIRGFRVETGEVESALRRLPQVRECVVLALAEPGGGRRLAAYYVAAANEAPGPVANELRRSLAKTLPDYMIPSAFVRVEKLPLTAHGKIDRKALPPPDGTETETEEQFAAPATATETTLAKIWRETLRREKIGVHDPFFGLGGHSLLAAQVISRVREAFGVEFSMRRFFEGPTIAEMAVTIEDLMIRQIDQMSEEQARQLVE